MKKQFIISVFVAVVLLSGCKNKETTSNPLAGKWRSVAENALEFSLTFNKDNSYISLTKGTDTKYTITGKYHISKDSLFIRDTLNKPLVICTYIDTGCYVFTQHHDTITFRAIKDMCERRRLAFEIGLIRMK